jgi:hypothetical protein
VVELHQGNSCATALVLVRERWKGLHRLDRIETTVRGAQSANPETSVVVRGDETMIPFIMATERLPGFENLVGRWDEARHRSALCDGRHAYFVAWDGSEAHRLRDSARFGGIVQGHDPCSFWGRLQR